MSNRVFASIYQLKITIKNSSPSIWRRIKVNDDLTLYQLHIILQAAMGWKRDHLYEFSINGSTYGPPDDENSDGEFRKERNLDDQRCKLRHVLTQEKMRFIYTYDFGDSWEHEIEVESIEKGEVKLFHPVCLDGDRACPPENIGGVHSYQELLNIPEATEVKPYKYKEIYKRCGYKFNPEKFNKERTNARLKTIDLWSEKPLFIRLSVF